MAGNWRNDVMHGKTSWTGKAYSDEVRKSEIFRPIGAQYPVVT